MDMNSLAHTKWECKYHLVFAPKYRRQIIYGKIKADVAQMLSTLRKRKGIEIMGYLKGKSSLMIFERHANLKYKYGNRHFWCRGYYVDTVGKNTKKIQEYIANQRKEDREMDQMTLNEYIDPFTGEPVKKAKNNP